MAKAYYGFTQEEWDAKTELDRQRVRNWAFEQKFKNANTAVIQASRQQLLVETPVETFDSIFGGFIFNRGLRKFFSNTYDALNPEDLRSADETLGLQDGFRGDLAKDKVRRNLESLRIGRQTSFSGSDITASITVGPEHFVIGNLSAISYSIHRDTTPVRLLGRTYPKSYVQASRTIAGTLVFTVFDTHVLHQVRAAVITEIDSGSPMSSPLTDQLPPFDVSIQYHNEMGVQSQMTLYGLQISDEGQTHSINDMLTENVMQYVARDIDLMIRLDDEWTPSLLAMNNAAFRSTTDGEVAEELALRREAQKLVEFQKRLGIVESQLIQARSALESLRLKDGTPGMATIDQEILTANIISTVNEIHRLEEQEKSLQDKITIQEQRMDNVGRGRTPGGGPDFGTHDTPFDMARENPRRSRL